MKYKREHIWKRICSLFLTLVLSITILPSDGISVLAESAEVLQPEEAGQDDQIAEAVESDAADVVPVVDEESEGVEEVAGAGVEAQEEEAEPADSQEEELVSRNGEETEDTYLTDMSTVTITFDGSSLSADNYAGFTAGTNEVTLTGGYDYVLTGNIQNRQIIIASDVNVTLDNFSSEYNLLSTVTERKGAIEIREGKKVSLTIRGDNIINNTRGNVSAGIYLTGNTDLIIKEVVGGGTNTLTCTTDRAYTSGIIGSDKFDGTLTIESGDITCKGGAYAAGIGVGQVDSSWYPTDMAGEIIIKGGRVNCTAGSDGAGIGAGGLGGVLSGSIQIQNSEVISEVRASYAAGIGVAGEGQFNGELTIENSRVSAQSSNHWGIGTGGSYSGKIMIKGGPDTEVSVSGMGAKHASPGGEIIIDTDGGSVETTRSGIYFTQGMKEGSRISIANTEVNVNASGIAGIGCGSTLNGEIEITGGEIIVVTQNGSGVEVGIGGGSIGERGKLVIADSSITAEARFDGTGIGAVSSLSGEVRISNSYVTASAGTGIGTSGSVNGVVEIDGGTVIAASKLGKPAIGGGRISESGEIIIVGDDNSLVTATSGGDLSSGGGAGIGSTERMNGTIHIKGGTVVAAGGWNSGGIGNANGQIGGNIIIEDAVVTATGGHVGPGIGTGTGDMNGSIVITGSEVKAFGTTGGAGIGSGRGSVDGEVRIINSSVEMKAGSGGGAGIGQGSQGTMTGLEVFIDERSEVKAYATGSRYAINATSVTGDGQFINLYFSDGSIAYEGLDISVYLSDSPDVDTDGDPDMILTLPQSCNSFAYTTGGSERTYAVMQLPEAHDYVHILNGDHTNPNNPAGHGPNGAGYREKVFQSANTALKWPAVMEESLGEIRNIEIEYHYFETDGSQGRWEDSDYSTSVIDGRDLTIETGSRIEAGYIPWYYTMASQKHDNRRYFADDGGTFTVRDSDEVRVYAISPVLDVSIPDTFFWYVNEDTKADAAQVTGAAGHVYEVKSGRYEIINNGFMPLQMSIGYEGIAGGMQEIETLLGDNREDNVVLNITGELQEQGFGQDMLNSSESQSYTGTLGAWQNIVYGFGGYYDPGSGKLPERSAASDYGMTLSFELYLGAPAS